MSLPPELVRQISDAFHVWGGYEHKRRLTLSEFRTILAAVGVSESDIRAVFTGIDTNCDGQLDWDEFLQWVQNDGGVLPLKHSHMPNAANLLPAVGKSSGQDVLKRIADSLARTDVSPAVLYDRVDSDRSGEISRDELTRLIRMFEPAIDTTELNSAFYHLDRNGDGKIDRREFAAALDRARGVIPTIPETLPTAVVARDFGPTEDELVRQEIFAEMARLQQQIAQFDETAEVQHKLLGQHHVPPHRSWRSDCHLMSTADLRSLRARMQDEYHAIRAEVESQAKILAPPPASTGSDITTRSLPAPMKLATETPTWDGLGRLAEAMFKVYDAGYGFPEWSIHMLSSGELASHATKTIVYYKCTDEIELVQRMVREREPVNIAMMRKYSEHRLQESFGYRRGAYMHSTQDRLMPNIAIFCRTPLEYRGYRVDTNVINLVGYAFDTPEQPDYRYFFGSGLLTAMKWQELVDRVSVVWRYAFQAARDHNLKYIYFSAVGGGAFSTYLNGRPETSYQKLWEASMPRVEAEFPEIRRYDLGRIPDFVHSSEMLAVLNDCLLVNAWDPFSMVGNGNALDASLDGCFGACTAMAVLCWPITNPCMTYRAVAEPTAAVPTTLVHAPAYSESTVLRDDSDHGLRWDRRWLAARQGPGTEATRASVRNSTKTMVARQLGLAHFGDNAFVSRWPRCQYADTTLFTDESRLSTYGSAAAGASNLLGRYDGVCVRACADYNMSWDQYTHHPGTASPPFWVLHMAAINIGESARAPDFSDFSNSRGLDEDSYVGSMRRLYDNMVVVCATLRIQHLVMFPFGMGAFLRHLPSIDRRYADWITMQRLRRRLASEFVDALRRCPEPRAGVHFACAAGGDGANEGACNRDAFIRAFAAADALVQQQVIIYPGADSLQLANDLAAGSGAVMLLNGSNRTLIGNHWFNDGAKQAIDENLHRRSWTLSAASYLMNGYGVKVPKTGRRPRELRENIENVMGGSTYNFT